MRILLVDDEKELVSTLAERLSLRGFDVEWTTDSSTVLERTGLESFDLAILDLKMPKVDGLTLKSKLQKRYPQMKFIFFTGYGSEEEFNIISENMGEEYYLVKPIDIQVLVETIKMVTHTETKEPPNGN